MKSSCVVVPATLTWARRVVPIRSDGVSRNVGEAPPIVWTTEDPSADLDQSPWPDVPAGIQVRRSSARGAVGIVAARAAATGAGSVGSGAAKRVLCRPNE